MGNNVTACCRDPTIQGDSLDICPPKGAHVQKAVVRTFEFEDRDGDGKISMAELRAGLENANMTQVEIDALFDFLDSNDDGVITLKELEAGLQKNGKLGSGLKAVGGKNRLVLVDRQADAKGVLASAVLKTHTVVVYDSNVDSLADIIGKVKAALQANGETFVSAALINHGGSPWQVAKDVSVRWEQKGHLAPLIPLTTALADATHPSGRVDLLACELLNFNPDLVTALEYMHRRNFTASDDRSGNQVAGADWVMESDGINISRDYFDPAKVEAFKDALLWGININPMQVMDCIPVVGTIARVGEAGVKFATGDTNGALSSLGDAALNAAGDAAGLVTGGAGKVAMTAAKVGSRVVVHQAVKVGVRAAVKAGAKAAMKAAARRLTKKAMANYAKRYFKRKIKRAVKREAKKIINEGKQMVREEMEAIAAEVMGWEEAQGLEDQELCDVVQTVAECEDGEWNE